MSESPHTEIQRLSAQLDQQRAQLGLPEPIAGAALTPMSASPSWKADAQCHPGQSASCTQACTLSDTICGNSDRICQLATELAGDPWAQDKCSAAKQTCSSAHEKCCACAP
jgi:hypothetical protein